MAVNLRKAAILLTSLPQEEAALLLGKLKPREVEAVSIEIAKLDRVAAEEEEGVIREFADANPNSLGGSTGGLELAKSLVQKALGKNAAPLIENVRQSIEAMPFSFLKKVDPQNLVTFVNDEHPQTIALVLSYLPPSYGAQVISNLQPDRQLAVIRRIAQMAQTSPEVIHEVEAGLEGRMANVMSEQYQKAGGVEAVAGILNVTDRATERSLMERLAQDHPELVDEIRRLMFVFDDIGKLSDKDIQTVLKNVENNQWAMALKRAPEEVKEKILGNMSSRAAEALKEEMGFLGAVRVSEVEAVQQKIVDIIRTLEDSNQITVQSGDQVDEFVQ